MIIIDTAIITITITTITITMIIIIIIMNTIGRSVSGPQVVAWERVRDPATTGESAQPLLFGRACFGKQQQ